MAKARSELKSTGYEIFIGVLSVLSIVNMVLVLVFVNDDSLRAVISTMNALFSVIFLGDFIYRLATAPSRSDYFLRKFGWADLLASLPFPQFKILRVFRLVRVVRLLRELGPREIGRTLVKDRAGSALFVLLIMGIFVLQFGSLFVLHLEQDSPDANITSGGDAIWYTLVTISTVGYGDRYPVTTSGRFMGAVIILLGVGIFGTFTGYLANLFLGSTPAEEAATTEPGTEVAAAAAAAAAESTTPATIDELRAALAKSEQTLAEMRTLLDRYAGT